MEAASPPNSPPPPLPPPAASSLPPSNNSNTGTATLARSPLIPHRLPRLLPLLSPLPGIPLSRLRTPPQDSPLVPPFRCPAPLPVRTLPRLVPHPSHSPPPSLAREAKYGTPSFRPTPRDPKRRRPGPFPHATNTSLPTADAKASQKITNIPIPDLASHPTPKSNSPFWICRPGEPRQRSLNFIVQRSEFRIQNPFPNALTLTMFTRLFLADLFIHGIGGAPLRPNLPTTS